MIYYAYSGCMLIAAWSPRNWVVWHTVPIWSIHHVLLQMVCWNWKKCYVLLHCTTHDPIYGYVGFSLNLKQTVQRCSLPGYYFKFILNYIMCHVNVTQKILGCVFVCFSWPVWICCLNSFVHPSCMYIHSSSCYLSTHPSQDSLLIKYLVVFSLCKCSAYQLSYQPKAGHLHCELLCSLIIAMVKNNSTNSLQVSA